jgi:hypothetical protein
LICDCRLSWLIELQNQTKNDDLKISLNEIQCLLKKSKDKIKKMSEILDQNSIEKPLQEPEEDAEYYDDESEGKICQLTKLQLAHLPCPNETHSEPTELPLPRESIGFDMSWVKVVSSSSSKNSSICVFLFFICKTILKLC